jgi:hypothetical protein
MIVRLLVLIAAGLASLLVGLVQVKASHPRKGPASADRSQPHRVQEDASVSVAGTGSAIAEDDGPIIQFTELISIPFGFDATLPLMDGGAAVLASGPGACTAGEEISIAITLTQSLGGASATGQWSGTCTGVDQGWKEPVTVASGPLFISGDAEACGHATTRDDGSVTDAMNWCDDVSLMWTVFLPVIQKP